MRTKFIWLTLVLGVFVVACQQPETSENSSPVGSSANDSVLPIQPLQIVSPFGIRLGYIGKTQTDSSSFYQVLASYEGLLVGFNLSIPRGEQAVAYFSTRGAVSDELIRVLQKIYQLPVDSAARFSEYVKADCFNLSNIYKADSGWTVGSQNKLFFRGASDTDDIPEIHLSVNEKEHWIEVAQDSMYRAGWVRSLTQK